MTTKPAVEQITAAMSGDRVEQCQRCKNQYILVELCQRCANQYILIWLSPGDDYNDFGDRYCPFCGLQTDELTGSVIL